MGRNKFRFSDMIPNAWFYKLKDMSKTRKQTTKKKLTPNNTTISQKKPQLCQPKHTANKTQKFTTTTATEPPTRSADRFPPAKHLSKPSDMIRFPEAPPRKSSYNRRSTSRRKKVPLFKPNSSGSSSDETDFPDSIKIPSELDSELDFVNGHDDDDDDNNDPFPSWPNSCNCRLSSSTADIIIDLNDDEKPGSVLKEKTTEDRFVDVVSEMIDLPPILTKPINFDDTIFEAKKHMTSRSRRRTADHESIIREHKTTNVSNNNISARKSSSGSSGGMRLRTNSPRLASKKIQAFARKSVSSRNNKHLSESFAVVKSSVDPQRDFRDSMVEMIVENNIRGSKDLEELLACYLSLNSKEYHDVIVKAFEQIWFDLDDIRV